MANPLIKTPTPQSNHDYSVLWLNSKLPKHWTLETALKVVEDVFSLRKRIEDVEAKLAPKWGTDLAIGDDGEDDEG